MKAHVLSDVHFECMSSGLRKNWWPRLQAKIDRDQPEVAFIAGDIGTIRSRTLFAALEEFSNKYKRVYFTAGNHENWQSSITETNRALRTLGIKNLTVLHPSVRSYLNPLTCVTGGTAWFPDCNDVSFKKGWSDYTTIIDSYKAIQLEHEAFKRYPPGDIVMSHHYPTVESIAPEWANDAYNVFFHAQLDQWIEKFPKPKLWIFGHTHKPFDYISTHGFRMYCNPHGYTNENANPLFWDRLCIDV